MPTRIDNNRLKTGLASGALLCLGTTMSVLALTAVSSASADETCVPSPAIAAVQGSPAIPAVPATEGSPAVPATEGSPAVPAVEPTEDVFEKTLFVFTKEFKPGDVLPAADNPEFMAVPADPNGHPFDQPIDVVFNVSNAPNGTPGLGSIFVFRNVLIEEGTLGSPAIPAVPATDAIPAVPATPAIPAVPAVEGSPAVPAVTCDDDGGSEPSSPTPVTEVLGESDNNNGNNNNGNNNNGNNNNGNNNGGGTPEVLGAQAFANNAPAAQQSAPAAQVPTVINAGTAGEAPANPLAPAAIALFGALMGLIALGMRGGLARLGGGKA